MTDKLIKTLAADLQPVKVVPRLSILTAGWLLPMFVLAAGSLWLLGPYRPGAWMQLLNHPQFLLESALGLVAIVALAVAAMGASIPGIRSIATWSLVAIAAIGAWYLMHAYGFVHPALTPSTLGERDTCFLEVSLVGVPLLMIGAWRVRRQWPIAPVRNGALVGLAAGAIPAFLMQFACMYEPAHIFEFHLLPGFALAPIGALLVYRQTGRG